MGLFTARRKSASAEQQAIIDFLNIGSARADKLSEATYFACLKILGETLGKLPLKLLKYSEERGMEKAYEHPLYRIIGSRPNRYMTAAHFWSTVEHNRNHYGNAYVWIRGAGSKLSLWILPPDSVQVWVDDRGIWGAQNAVWYTYAGTAGTMRISHDSMLHLRTSASFDGITGRPVKTILADTLQGNLTAQAMLNRSYENGFTGKAVLQYTGELSKENELRFGKKIEEFLSGDDLKKVIPMAYGTQLTPVNTKLADNEFLGLKRYSALQIAAAFGIKPNQINDYEKASYASAEAQQLAFYVDTLLYILKQYEEELSFKLLSDEETAKGYHFKFNVAVILRADQKTQVETLKSAVQGGIYTPNEARALLDKESKPGGDQLLANGSMLPLTQVGAAYKKGGE